MYPIVYINGFRSPLIMNNNRERFHENGQLSIDFIIGFTIFMISFIFIATIISGLLINLQTRSIDYDAVAYRTGVVLVEDPGEFGVKGEPFYWQLLNLANDDERKQLERLGLAIDRNSPGIIQAYKIEKFFSPATSGCIGTNKLCYPSDYSQKLIFGDYPYNFNISLKELNGSYSRIWCIGEKSPEKYGYIRRVVMIKNPGYIEINLTNSTSNSLTLNINQDELNSPSIHPAYKLNPYEENITIFIKNVTIPDTQMVNLQFFQRDTPIDYPGHFQSDPPTITVDGTVFTSPITVNNNTKVIIEAGYLRRWSIKENDPVKLEMSFNQPVSDGFPIVIPDPDYTTLPPLSWAIMEIKIW